MAAHILLIDDDRELCELLTDYLQLEGFQVEAVHDGAEAVKLCEKQRYDALVLDVMLPGMQGFDVLRRLRRFSRIPVIMLTARGDDTDRIVGLEMGADDYLPKPCNPRELAARLRAILRRATPTSSGLATELEAGGLRVSTSERTTRLHDQQIHLTTAEFNILVLLLRHAGEPVERDTLSEQALGRALTAYDRSVDVHVSKLRKKLAAAHDGELIANIRGKGYQLLSTGVGPA
jgi:DNA-binding response OmpR family regulator